MLCQSCGTKNVSDAQFCHFCSQPLVSTDTSSPSTTGLFQESPPASPNPLFPFSATHQDQHQSGWFERMPGWIGMIFMIAVVVGLSGVANGWIYLWDMVTTPSPVITHSTSTSGPTAFAWSPDSTSIVSAEANGAQIWDAQSGKPLLTYTAQSAIEKVAWSPDGKHIASIEVNRDNYDRPISVAIWDAHSGKPVLNLPLLSEVDSTGVSLYFSVAVVAWSPDSKYLATGGSDVLNNGQVQIWDASSGKLLFYWKGGPNVEMTFVSWSPDGKRIAVGGEHSAPSLGVHDDYDVLQMNPIAVFDALTGEHSFTFTGHKGQITGLAWSPNNQWIASASQAQEDYDNGNNVYHYNESTLQVWNPIPGGRVHSYPMEISHLSWSPDSQRLVLGDGDHVSILNALNGEHLFSYHRGILSPQDGGFNWSIAWSPDGTRIAASSDRFEGLTIWNLQWQTRFIGQAYVPHLLQIGIATSIIGSIAFLLISFATRSSSKRRLSSSKMGCGLGCSATILLLGALVIASMVLFGLFPE